MTVTDCSQVDLELGYIVISFFKEELGWIEVMIDDRILVQGGKGLVTLATNYVSSLLHLSL